MVQFIYLLSNFALFVGVFAANEDAPIVSTKSGKIQGFIDKSTKGKSFYTFHKIPFAEPPVGKLRFKNPTPIRPWEGIRDGSISPVSCPCPDYLGYLKDKREIYLGEEDCLHLSIYTPKIDEELLPVMLFIHGGGFMASTGSIFTGHELLNENIVYVAIEYRLGVLGFLSTEDEVMPGNLGLKDQTLALQWIQENVEYFGGDPSKVTIFGESAGGASVHYHLLSPASKGLFSQAILQSGTAFCPWTHSGNKRSIAHQFGAVLGCLTPASVGENQSERLMKCLQDVDAETITMAITKFTLWHSCPKVFSPYFDGNYLPDHPETLMNERRHEDVDIMIGVAQDDGAWYSQSVYSNNDQIEKLQTDFDFYGPISLGFNQENSSLLLASEVYNHYLGKMEVNEQNADQVTEMFGDCHFKICTDLVTEMYSKNVKSTGKKVYSYQLDYRGGRSLVDYFQIEFGKHWIGHADDLFYLFAMQSVGGFPKRNQSDKRIRDIFTKLWTNFAATGNPTPDTSLGFTWTPFTEETPNHLSIKLQPEMKAYDRKEVHQFWSSLPTHQNELLHGKTRK